MTYEEFLEEWRNPDNHFYAMTSGSTGLPKQIQIEKVFAKESAERTIRFFEISSGSHLHSCISADFIGGKMMAVRSEIARCEFTWEVPSNRPLIQLDKGEKIDLVSVVPSQMLFILDNLVKLPVVKTFLVGGSSIDKSLRERIAKSGINAYESYGMTETASHIAVRRITEDIRLPFQTMDGIHVSSDSRGCLIIICPDGKSFKTNDLCEIFSDHEFLIKGRIDNIIITGGRKVNPMEVETKIRHLLNSEYIISGEHDEKWGEKIVLIIEESEGDIDERNLISEMKKLLPSYEVPKEIKKVACLPRTANGKLKRK